MNAENVIERISSHAFTDSVHTSVVTVVPELGAVRAKHSFWAETANGTRRKEKAVNAKRRYRLFVIEFSRRPGRDTVGG